MKIKLVENDTSSKLDPEQIKCNNTYVWQNRVQNKDNNTRQTWTFCNDKGGNISGTHITHFNIYAPNLGAAKCIKQLLTELKGENDKNKIIVGDLNALLTAMNRSSKQKTHKKLALNDPLHQMDVIYICIAFHPDHTSFSCAHITLSRIGQIICWGTKLT